MLVTKYKYWDDYTDGESEQEVNEDFKEIGSSVFNVTLLGKPKRG